MKNFPSTCPSFCTVDTVAAVLGLHFVIVGQSSRAPFIVYQHRYRSSSLVLRYPLFVKTSVRACLASRLLLSVFVRPSVLSHHGGRCRNALCRLRSDWFGSGNGSRHE